MPVAREAQVPPPYGTTSVSPEITRTAPISTPKALAAICAAIASWPWPCSVPEVVT